MLLKYIREEVQDGHTYDDIHQPDRECLVQLTDVAWVGKQSHLLHIGPDLSTAIMPVFYLEA